MRLALSGAKLGSHPEKSRRGEDDLEDSPGLAVGVWGRIHPFRHRRRGRGDEDVRPSHESAREADDSSSIAPRLQRDLDFHIKPLGSVPPARPQAPCGSEEETWKIVASGAAARDSSRTASTSLTCGNDS